MINLLFFVCCDIPYRDNYCYIQGIGLVQY